MNERQKRTGHNDAEIFEQQVRRNLQQKSQATMAKDTQAMTECEVTISNETGIHARPAAKIVQVAARFSSKIEFQYENDIINAKSIMGIITLGAVSGTVLKVVANGADEVAAIEALQNLFMNNFEED